MESPKKSAEKNSPLNYTFLHKGIYNNSLKHINKTSEVNVIYELFIYL